jgi:hypothetical protein
MEAIGYKWAIIVAVLRPLKRHGEPLPETELAGSVVLYPLIMSSSAHMALKYIGLTF